MPETSCVTLDKLLNLSEALPSLNTMLVTRWFLSYSDYLPIELY